MAADRHIQARFLTKQPEFSVPDVPYSIPINVGYPELSQLINSVLKETTTNGHTSVGFDFLIAGEFVRSSLLEHLELKGVSTETVVEIEYFEEYPPPNARDGLQHDDWVSSIEGSNDCFLSGCYDNTVHIWTKDGRSMVNFTPHTGPVKAVRWLATGEQVCSFITASHDQTIIIWEWNTITNETECVSVCRGHERSVDCIAIDPDKKYLATGSHDNMLKVWSLLNNEENSEVVETQRKRLKSDGRTVVNKTPIGTLAGHHEAITAVQWTGPNEVCTGSSDHTIRIWDMELGGMKSQLAGTKNFLDVAYSPLNNLLVSGSTDPHIRLWDPRSSEGNLVKSVFTSHTNWVPCVRWSTTSEYHFISGSYDEMVKEWDIRSPRVPYFNLTGHKDKVLCCDWTNPQFILSGGADNRLEIYDYSSV